MVGEAPVIIQRTILDVSSKFFHRVSHFCFRGEIFQDLVTAAVVQSAQLIRISFVVAPRDRPAAVLDVAIIYEHDERIGPQVLMKLLQKHFHSGLWDVRPPERGETGSEVI